MQFRNMRNIGLVLLGCVAAATPLSAAELKLGGDSRALRASRGDTITIERLPELPPERLPLDGNEPNGFIKMEPLRQRVDTVYVGDASGAASVAGVNEKLAYEAPLGSFALALPVNQVVADDMTLLSPDGCNLRKYSFSVIGRANPALGGGPYTVEYALYGNCPQAGGTATTGPIPGTEGVMAFADDSVINVITKEIPLGTDIPLSRTVWLGIKPNRSNVGVIGGAPAFTGFSSDILDFPGSACAADAGGFPNNPHASIRAAIYVDDACSDNFPAYHNILPARSGFNPGSRICFADDLELNTNNCQMIGFDVGVKFNNLTQTAGIQLRMFQDSGGLPGAEIPGSFRSATFTSGPGAYIARITFDPPINLPSDRVWLAYESGVTGAGWILTRKNAAVGNTAAGFARSESGARCSTMVTTPDWVSVLPTDVNAHGGFDVVVHCAGQAPTGACCDMFLTDDGFCSSGTCFGGEFDGLDCVADIDCQGDPICREVPEMNCSFPPRNTGFRPRWQEGLTCRRCSGGTNDGNTCNFADDCPGGTCTGSSPFTQPCGVAACCHQTEQGAELCANLLEKECILKPPPYDSNGKQWQLGRYCGIDGQRCPRIACLGREGRCTEPRPRNCDIGGVTTEESCERDSDCGAICTNPICFGGSTPFVPCGSDADCPGGGICRQTCVGGSMQGQFCTSDTQCNDDGTCVFIDPNNLAFSLCFGGPNDGQVCEFNIECEPGGICSNRQCQGGVRDLQACQENRDCIEALCPGSPGCENPLCCTAVCDLEFSRLGTSLCCDLHWLQFCADFAAEISQLPGNDCLVSPNNDTCRAGDRTDGARAIELGTSLEAPMAGTTHELNEPAFCCHTGFESQCKVSGEPTGTACQVNEDCWTGSCARFCDTGLVGNSCTGEKRCFDPQNPGAGKVCTFDEDCGGDPVVCVAPECFNGSQGTCGPLTCDTFSGSQSGNACNTDADCNTFRVCELRAPMPATLAAGAAWFQFTVPPGDNPVNVVASTCRSTRNRAHDSMLQVFATGNPDAGVCGDLGACSGSGDPCNVITGGCADGTSCVAERVTCSIADQNCPLDRPCIPDLTTQCNSLVLMGCNDDDANGCSAGGEAGRPGNSKLCVSGLNPGDTYFVELGHKGEDMNFDPTDGVYRLDVTATTSCAGQTEPNDACINALDVADGEYPFNLDLASYDCPAPSCAPGSRNDVWFRYTAPITGTATFSTCGEDAQSTPNTEMALYLGCECPRVDSVITPIDCSSAAGGNCGEGSLIFRQVQAGECYLVRVGDLNFNGGTGNLTITTVGDDCNSNGIEDVCDIDCDLPGCAVSGCGQSIDCNNNMIPDECEKDTGCCPIGTVTFTDPPPGVVDAGHPLDPYNGGVPLGISSIEVSAPPGAGFECWDLCETATTGVPNGFTVTDHGDGTYTLELDRPITPGACTTISFLAGDGSVSFANFRSHPGNVDASGFSNAGDVTALVNLLNGIGSPAHGLYSTDVNRSGGANAADILALIDVLNGAGPLTVWNNTPLPSCTICQPTQ